MCIAGADDPVLGGNVAIKTLRLIDLADRLKKPGACTNLRLPLRGDVVAKMLP